MPVASNLPEAAVAEANAWILTIGQS